MNTRKILIAGGVLAGAFVLYELIKPGSTLVRPSTAPTRTQDGGVVAGLLGLAGAFGSFGGSSKSPSGSSSYGPNVAGGNGFYLTDTSTGASYGNAAAYNNYDYADSHPGTALPEGVYGPPVPSSPSYGATSSGDDGLVSV